MATRLTLAGEQAEAFDQPAGPPTGFRTRLRVVPPLTHTARRDTAAMVVAFALNAASYLRTDPEPFATVSMQQQEGRRSRKKPQGF